MFSHALTLNDFAYSIPICQPEADLGSILNIFKHDNCQIIAVPLQNNTWGTISSQDLLSLMAQLWQTDTVAMVSHPQIAYQEDISHLTYDNFDHLIKPAIAYPGKIKLQEFLNNLEDISFSDREYLIIDELGKLQGRLKTSRILKYLASNLDQTIANTPQILSQPMMANSFNTDKFLDNNTSVCWLTLATKASIANSVAIQLADEASATTEKLVDKLLGTISHELRSPLTGIVGLSSLFKDQQLGKLNQRQLSYAQLIYRGGQKLMSIVNDLLELTSLTVEKFQPQPEAIDLEFLCLQLFRQAMSKYKSASAAESNFFPETQLKLDIEPGAEKAIADKVHLSTILSHLILETLFCEPAHSILTIEAKNRQECTAITVSNGLMSDFELASSTDNFGYPQQSSGLNLVIAQYLAQIAQAKIQSDYSNGCQLTLLLPQAKTEMSNHSSDTDLAFDTQDKVKKNLTVLCLYPEAEMVDPTINNYNGLNFNLKNWAEQDWTNISKQHHYQHRIIEADGLEQAHTLARIWKLDVIVLDGHQIADPAQYWRLLQGSEYLTALPIVTLDTRTTEAANQIEGLNVYPCLLRADCRGIKELIQVIQIATGVGQ